MYIEMQPRPIKDGRDIIACESKIKVLTRRSQLGEGENVQHQNKRLLMKQTEKSHFPPQDSLLPSTGGGAKKSKNVQH